MSSHSVLSGASFSLLMHSPHACPSDTLWKPRLRRTSELESAITAMPTAMPMTTSKNLCVTTVQMGSDRLGSRMIASVIQAKRYPLLSRRRGTQTSP